MEQGIVEIYFTYMLTEDNERCAVGKLRPEVDDRPYGLVYVEKTGEHHEHEYIASSDRMGRSHLISMRALPSV